MCRLQLADIRATFLLCLAGILAGQTFAAAQTSQPADYSQEALVFEQIRAIYRFENDGTGRRELYMRVRTQTEAGVQQYGQIVFGYNSANERADVAFVRVHKPDGSVIATSPDAVQDLSAPVERIAPIYTDFRQKHVTVQSLRPKDVLEFSVVTTIHTALAPGQFWSEYNFEDDVVVLDEQLEVNLPAGRNVTLKVRSGLEAVPKEDQGRRIYRWTQSQLKTSNERKAAAETQRNAKKETKGPAVPAVRLTTFQTWEEVGRWYAALEAPQRVPTPEIRTKAAELIAGRQTDLEKLEALYDYVATNFRYVSLSLGLGRYQPRQAGAVLQEQYGDCKDKHTLLASLIDASGLNASAVLINTDAKIDPAFPSPSQFNHVITLAAAGGKEVWMDTTSEVAPFQLLMGTLRNKQGLVVDAAASRLHVTPANPPMKSLVLQEIDATLGGGGKLDAHVRISARGDLELLLRTIFRRTPPAQWEEVLKAFTQELGGSGDIANIKVSDPAALRDPFTFELNLSIPRYANWTSKRVTIDLPLGRSGSTLRVVSEDTTEPISIGAAPSEIAYKLKLTLPADVTARLPLSVKLTRDYAEYRADYTVAGTVLSATRVASVHIAEVPANRRQDVLAFLKVMETDSAQRLSLETSAPITTTTSAPDLTVAQLNRRGYDALQANNYAEAITVLKRVVELEPKDTVAWNNLGRAYLALGQTAEAIDAFEKQIAINPYDQYAYNNLGRAYASKRDYVKAEAAFLKQLEVNPLDKYAPTKLGALYLERENYDRAAEQFEKAIALNPDDSWTQFQAGKSYLHLKQVEKAMAFFDRAVERSPNSGTWNNIAYELSLEGIQLERAQQYAESAVASVTAASRNLDISRGDSNSLTVVRSLATYWDTLGWVHFARGDLDKAMAYVEMAWNLGQHAEVGEHLGQIYEKLGRRNEAITTYRLALGSRRPSNTIRARLTTLVGDATKVDAIVDTNRSQLSGMRSYKVSGTSKANVTAEFLVLFSSPNKVEAVRFISGDNSLRPFADAISTTSFGKMFPDPGPAKLLRRALLGCAPGSGCAVTLILPDDAEPVK
jgi:tetratricopeptide (TPR) repeat protein